MSNNNPVLKQENFWGPRSKRLGYGFTISDLSFRFKPRTAEDHEEDPYKSLVHQMSGVYVMQTLAALSGLFDPLKDYEICINHALDTGIILEEGNYALEIKDKNFDSIRGVYLYNYEVFPLTIS